MKNTIEFSHEKFGYYVIDFALSFLVVLPAQARRALPYAID